MLYLNISARIYYGAYLLTRAELGRKTVNEYNDFIALAWKQNPYHNDTSLKHAQVLQSKGQWEQSRAVLLKSVGGANHWQGWAMQGIAWERLAFSDVGTLADAERAAVLYDRALKVHPRYIKGLERRGLLGLKLGDWGAVHDLAARLIAIDANNRNALYLRARAAEGSGDLLLAWDLYGQLSAGGAHPQNSWFTSREVSNKLAILKEKRIQ